MQTEFLVKLDTERDEVTLSVSGAKMSPTATTIMLTRALGIAKKNNEQNRYEEKLQLYSLIDTLVKEWEFAPREEYVYSPGDTNAVKLNSGDCVYFARLTKLYPGMIKIGRTKDLQARTVKLYSDNLQSPVELLAFVRSVDSVQLESAFHKLFAEHRFAEEHFHESPIQWYLSTQRKS